MMNKEDKKLKKIYKEVEQTNQDLLNLFSKISARKFDDKGGPI